VLRVVGSFVPSVWVSAMDKGILVINPTDAPQPVRLLWRTPVFYALTNATTRPTSTLPLVQEITLTLHPHDWAFLQPIADLSPPVEVTTEAKGKDSLRLRLGNALGGKVNVRFWLPSNAKNLQAVIEQNGATQRRRLAPDQWGRFVLEGVQTPSTLTVEWSE